MTNDPAIDEIRRIRREISQETEHDLRKLKKTFSSLESQFERPPVDYGKQRTTGRTKVEEPADMPVENLSQVTGDA